MIRMVQSKSEGQAKSYFSDALLKADYFINDQELNGQWHGKIADRIGIKGFADKETFFALCENKNPLTGGKLTPRTKEERTVGYDINFHCPKSVSILHALSNDSHLLDAFSDSVEATMRDIELDAKTRVRKKGIYADRETGELIWADFVHQTSRPVKGHVPDPHLHCHCFVFNVTWDATEKKYKAGQFRDIKRDMPYYQARFHKRLADKLMELGYGIEKTRTAFEITGVPKQLIQHFAKRTDEIGRIAKELGITDKKELDELGARTRGKKEKGLSMAELKTEWRKQIEKIQTKGGSDKSGSFNGIVRFAPVKESASRDAQQCVDYALLHSFERASVMSDRRILQSAYRFSLGDKSVSVDAITDQFKKDKRIIHVMENGRKLCTTKEVLAEEKRMVALAKEGIGKLIPVYKDAPETTLFGQQADAVCHVLTTSNRVSIIRGAAGAGKTTLMKEAVRLFKEAGKEVITVAPSADASRGVLKSEGFEKAETVARLLIDKEMQQRLKNQVLWVDEAGLLGTKDMVALLQLAKDKNAQLILGGDTRQHASVVRGDALRILNTVGGIKTAEVSKIYRQLNEQYKSAVYDLSKGDVKSAFEKLDDLEFIKEIDPLNPNEMLVNDYLKAVKENKSVLIISPTHKQGDSLTHDIRQALREEGLIGKRENMVLKLQNLNLTEAEKMDASNFQEGQFIQFNQNAPGIRRGTMWVVEKTGKDGVHVKNADGNMILLPLDKSKRYDVFQKTEIGLSKGDKLRITRNGFALDGKRLENGQILDVVKANKKGNLILLSQDGKTRFEISRNYGHLNHAQCVTSHAAQSKTVDYVFIMQPASTFPATDAKQVYVSISRGRLEARIYTDGRVELLWHASQLGDRQSAIELTEKRSLHQQAVQQRQRGQINEQGKGRNSTRQKEQTVNKDNYER